MAHGTASGWLQWGDKRYEFRDAPAYGEKNWGAGFPSKWHWVQCNSFDDQSQLSVTAVGAKRALVTGLPVLGAVGEEEVGLIGIHHNGQFYEFVPQNAEVEWDVDPWGRWWIRARNGTHEALIEATADAPGAVLRAPTPRDGLAAVCRDTFFGRCRLRLWPLGANRLPVPGATPIVDALSSTAALEVGGGPWFTNWSASARMAEPVKALLGLPIDVVGLKNLTPPPLRPPGL